MQVVHYHLGQGVKLLSHLFQLLITGPTGRAEKGSAPLEAQHGSPDDGQEALPFGIDFRVGEALQG